MGKAANSSGNIESGMNNTVCSPFSPLVWLDELIFVQGPIVRIGPDEVHIQDTDFYFTLFSSPQKLDKLKRLENRFNSNTSMFSTPKHELHRMRRSALNPFFSTRKIALYAPVIQNRMNRLCDRLEEEYSATGRILVLDDMWACMTSDTIIEYCFGEHHGDLELPDFRSFFNNAIFDLTDGIHVATHFSWIVPLGNSLPLAVVKTLQPAMASVIIFQNLSIQIISKGA